MNDVGRFGRVLRRLRTERGWTLRELDERAGVPIGRSGATESRNARVMADSLARYAYAFGMGLDELWGMVEDDND